MNLREHITNLSDRELAELLIKEVSYDDADYYDDDFTPPYIVTTYITTDNVAFDWCYGYEEAVKHQITLLNSEYKEKNKYEN